MTTPTPETPEQAAREWFAAKYHDCIDHGYGCTHERFRLASLLRQREDAARREGWKAGAEAMREKAARRLTLADPGPVYKTGGALVLDAFDHCTKLIRALPLPEPK